MTMPIRCQLALAAVWIAACLGAAGPLVGQEAQGPLEVPGAEAIGRAEKIVRELFADDYAGAESSQQKLELASKLIEHAARAKGDPAGCFVLLRVARDVAIQTGDAQAALEAIDRTAEIFQVESVPMKLDCLRHLGQTVRLPAQMAALAESAAALIDRAASEERYAAAIELAEIARDWALRARRYSLSKEAGARIGELQARREAFEAFRAAIRVLEQSPGDPASAALAGRYLCLARGQWEQGLPLMAKGGDSPWKAAAERELAGAETGEAAARVGDAWWELAEGCEATEKAALLRHAGAWYRRASAGLPSGLVKIKVDKRLEQLGDAVPETASPRATGPVRIYLEPSGDWFDTGVRIDEGSVYEIQASGKWRGSDGANTGPDGLAPVPYADSMGPFGARAAQAFYLGQHPKNALIGTFGDWEHTFYIGSGCRWMAPVSGSLKLRINDDPTSAARRMGRLTLVIRPVEDFTWAGQSGVFEFAARSDSVDQLHVTPEGLFWVHMGGFGRIGQHNGYYPTIVNGTYWWPDWPEKNRTALLTSPDFFPPAKKRLEIQQVVSPRALCEISSQNEREVVFTVRSNGMGSVGIRVECAYK